jgi:hypothetical protein
MTNTSKMNINEQGLEMAYIVSQSQLGMDYLAENLLKEDVKFPRASGSLCGRHDKKSTMSVC